MTDNIQKYMEHRRCEEAMIVAAYDLQCEIERRESELSKLKDEYKAQMETLTASGIRGTFFNVTDLRARREVDVDYIRNHLPDAFDRCATLSNAAIIEILETTTPGGKSGLIHSLKRLDPRKFNQKVHINVTDLEKALGKRICHELEGTAIKTVYSPGSKTRVLYIGDRMSIGAGDNEPQEALE